MKDCNFFFFFIEPVEDMAGKKGEGYNGNKHTYMWVQQT